MIRLTTEQAQQIENAFSFAESQADYPPDDLMLYHEALYTIRAARAQELVTVVKPWAYGGSTGVNDYLMSDGSIRALTPDEVKAINAAPQPVKQEPVAKFLEDNLVVENERVDKSGHRVLEIREEELLRIMEIYAAPVQQAEQEPLDDDARDNMLLWMIQRHFPSLPLSDEHTDWGRWLGFANAVFEAGRKDAAPVRTKDLTVDEKVALADRLNLNGRIVVIDAVIAAHQEKNK